MERTTLLNELIGSLSYKVKNGKSCEARHDFDCSGCEETVAQGGEFYFIDGEKYCPDCMAEALEEAKAWLEELTASPEDKSKDRGIKVCGDAEML